MLLVVTGGIGCGKSAYAETLAESHGREAIRLACPAWPLETKGADKQAAFAPEPEDPGPYGFAWSRLYADDRLSGHLNRINRSSNPFRADRRVVLMDSLSGWLRQLIADARAGSERCDLRVSAEGGDPLSRCRPGLEAAFRDVLGALLGFQGTRVVVTEDTIAGLASDPWERLYIGLLCEANRRLSEQAHGIYRLTSGLAAEVRGERVKRRNPS
ncbi:bifunctional adenosylcobinamide kinase/adenosylcobinamide-phosphate guanylyltransferase [Cohnella nanjingensis]|uniref:Bifunctional adenosylcobinamide kinase/adenosylcobinamide-phosphate guanylyltransferase n=1 Tax=Cohnella nanjingensis TaxID=1387779 RepID=A0A7X0RNX2_9BACL|nr:bifunctional adenosylcobinamide kinase/adenosylcobinamide-phosphate guanylyltransferase [Cohnella nanjingensis]MBB6669705.1 bifunctional adenosylcobinamide kinase/adenosylcobinamide-phosphate guanylyltransferase [Cohnella nanjingensis]